MLDFLFEFLLSIAIAIGAGYFLFLSSPSPAEVAASATKRRSIHGDYDDNGQQKDTTRWVAVVQRWVVSLVLGGGSTDADVWSDRLSACLDESLRNLCSKVQQQKSLLPSIPLIRVERLSLGSAHPSLSHHSRSLSSGTVEGIENGGRTTTSSSSPLLPGASLPILESISSSEVSGESAPGGQTMRELRCTLSFVDSGFHLQLHCEVPLLFGLPPSLSIPPDVLTMRVKVDVKRVCWRAPLCIRMRGTRVEFFFEQAPDLSADITAAHPMSRRGGGGTAPPSMDAKAGELLSLALRRAVDQLVFPNMIVLEVCRESPCLRWSRDRLESVSI